MNFGTLNLKRAYQKNMLVGFISAGVFFASAFALASSFNKESIQVIIEGPGDNEGGIILIPPPPPGDPDEARWIDTGRPPEPPEIGEIVAVPDPEAPENTEIPTQNELMGMIPETPEIDPIEYASVDNIEEIVKNLLPQHDEFVPYDEGPVAINKVSPKYPVLAWKARLEGIVWVKALIDKEGKVRGVMAINSSEVDAGFEEAAIEAAYKTTWKPAIANGQPTAVWITYKVEFVLK
jgi:protein TonB